jgi:hypothetical protein
LKEEHRLRVFENRVLGRIFGPKRDKVTEEWRKLHNKEHCDLYSLPSIIRIIEEVEMGGSCILNGGEDEYMQVIGGKVTCKETTRKM